MFEVVLLAQLQARPTLDPLNPANVVTPPKVDQKQDVQIDTRQRILPDLDLNLKSGEGQRGNTNTNNRIRLGI